MSFPGRDRRERQDRRGHDERRAGPLSSALLAGALAAGGCSSMDVTSDFDPAADFRRYRTWDWMPDVGMPGSDSGVTDAMVRGQFQSAVADELLRRGFQLSLDDPDFRVAYHASLETKLRMTVVNEYYGYDYLGSYGSTWGPAKQGQAALPEDYEQGTLLLDIVDAETRRLVWRGTVQAQVYRDLDAKKREERIREAVKKALAQFPPR
jgi:hypothetical protein